MGAFVLGILVGWLAEWLFFTFWVKGGNNSDCSSIMAELEERKREINRLQSRLNEATSSAAAAASTTTSTSTKAESTSTAASASKTATTKAATKKVATTKATPKKAAPKKTTAKATPKKATAKKAAPKKAAAKTSAKTKSTAKAKKSGDDFTKLSGIGPSIESTLKSLGIDTFTKLAGTDDDILRDMLEASGARLNNNKEAMDTWNEQATLAAKGDFEGLKKFQEALKR